MTIEIVDVPIRNRGFSIAMLNYQRVDKKSIHSPIFHTGPAMSWALEENLFHSKNVQGWTVNLLEGA